VFDGWLDFTLFGFWIGAKNIKKHEYSGGIDGVNKLGVFASIKS